VSATWLTRRTGSYDVNEIELLHEMFTTAVQGHADSQTRPRALSQFKNYFSGKPDEVFKFSCFYWDTAIARRQLVRNLSTNGEQHA